MKLHARHVANIAFASACAILFGACADSIIYVNKKEKIIERNAPPSPVTYADVFTFGVASGKADVLWVVDNTERAAPIFDRDGNGKSLLQSGYERVAKSFTTRPGVLQNVEFQNQVILTPSGAKVRSTGTRLIQVDTLSNHLKELFQAPRGLLIPAREGATRDFLPVTPLQSVKDGVSGTAFNRRLDARLYIVFVLGSRESELLDEKTRTEFLASVSADNQIQGVKVFNIVPGNDVDCRPLRRPEKFLSDQSAIGWNVSEVEGDICAEDPRKWADSVTNWIVKGQREFHLTFVPENPEAMTVYAGAKRRTYNVDYIYNPKMNSIEFDPSILPATSTTPGAALFDGAKIEVHYEKHTVVPLGGI